MKRTMLAAVALGLLCGVGVGAPSAVESGVRCSSPGLFSWSASVLAESRQEERPVLLVVSDASRDGCAPVTGEIAVDADTLTRLRRDFVLAPIDRLVRPDLADLYGLAVRELGGGEGSPLLVAVAPDATPYLGRAGTGAFDPAALERFATDAVAGFRTARSGLDTRAAGVLATLRAAQVPSPSKGPLEADTIAAAVRAVVGWSELGRADVPLPHSAIRLLVSEHERTRRPELLKLASTALDLRLARGLPVAASTAEEAQRLQTWTRAFAASGAAAHRAEAARSADRLLAARDAHGLWGAGAGDPTVVVQTNGLAIEALALSARTLGREADREGAVVAASTLSLRPGAAASLPRIVDRSAGGAFLDDYAALVAGLLELYETTDAPRWRNEAQALADAAVGRFLDANAGGFFLTDAAHEPLPVRVKHAFDGALPSANGTMARVLPRLSRATGEPRYADLARRTVDAFLGDLQRAPRGLLTLAEAAGVLLGPAPVEGGAIWSAPSREVRGAITLEARAPASAVRPGGSFEAALELKIAPGSFVVARSGGAMDLAGLGVSVPLPGARQGSPRYPEASPRRFGWSAEPIAVYEGSVTVPIRITLPRNVPPGARPLRMRVLFQTCSEARCEKPETSTLEVPLLVRAER